MWIVLPKAAGMQEISFLDKEKQNKYIKLFIHNMQEIFVNGKLLVGMIQTHNKDATYCHKNVKTPDAGHQVKHAQLTGLVELGVLALGEVETPVHLLQGNPNATRPREHITVSAGDTSALSA